MTADELGFSDFENDIILEKLLLLTKQREIFKVSSFFDNMSRHF